MNIFQGLEDRLEAAKPHVVRGLTRADRYACRIIELLEEIARDDTTYDQRIKRWVIPSGGGVLFDVPVGEDWDLASIVLAPQDNTLTTVQLIVGDTIRYARSLTGADTPVLPGIVLPSGVQVQLVVFGSPTITITLIARIKRRRSKRARGVTGDQQSQGLAGSNELEYERGFTDEAVHIDTPPRQQTESGELGMLENEPEPSDIYDNAEQIIP